MEQTLLNIENLKTYFYTDSGVVKAVDDVDLSIKAGTTLAIVGESGSGKSILASSIMQLIPQPPGKIVSGSIYFQNQDLLALPEKEMRQIRGNRITMIFQEPMTSLNPVFKIGRQVEEVIVAHRKVGKDEAKEQAIELLQLVGIPAAEERVNDYPHQLSGGMRQRVMIAIALACNPELLIADEPTTALDVTIQAQILDLMKRLQKEFGMAILMITHDLGVVAEMASEVAVMYAGQIVEYAGVDTIFESPVHPYTAGLLQSIPRLDVKQETLFVIEGVVPNPICFPPGCRFAPRCSKATGRCQNEQPELLPYNQEHLVRCHFPGG
ncbi:MAG: ABC transporter ATP-binding protein [Dethiobacteria bacterium]|nr:ABC transporter ATP-binding protein [Bacillota bacterium]NMD32945.1 ABC transporter ATP-binding protein [Bacillota bacterium]HOB28536.1 ABC transporter ATP-binding protein [Bacillota bacterium]HPZ40997.1 ABC transporter ATP-binding protein [Bacillota bacterium]HQD52088.1 ABC transporter ATP-binding protein [Bacillota bacterium]